MSKVERKVSVRWGTTLAPRQRLYSFISNKSIIIKRKRKDILHHPDRSQEGRETSLAPSQPLSLRGLPPTPKMIHTFPDRLATPVVEAISAGGGSSFPAAAKKGTFLPCNRKGGKAGRMKRPFLRDWKLVRQEISEKRHPQGRWARGKQNKTQASLWVLGN